MNLSKMTFRQAIRADIDACFAIEEASYPSDEAATLESLVYRQEQAGDYFRCAVYDSKVVGFITGTKCGEFVEESMTTHDERGRLLAIHSVAVDAKYRRKGLATRMMKDYIDYVENIDSIVLIAKEHLLGFYVKCGFAVLRPSAIVHGKDLWYDLERRMIRSSPAENQKWFVKTETFCKPFPDVKPFLDEHKLWVHKLRSEGISITSGYRVDSEGKPGGGGLMFLAAENYEAARAIVSEDPLVANGCVEWELNGWIGQVGNVEMR